MTAEPVLRDARLNFRVDASTKSLIERAAALQNRKVTDYCLGVLTDAARRTVTEAEGLVLSPRDRAAFFDALMSPPERPERLDRALASRAARVADG